MCVCVCAHVVPVITFPVSGFTRPAWWAHVCHKVSLLVIEKYYNCPSSRHFPVSHPVFYGNHKNIAEARHPTAGKSERNEKNWRACERGLVCRDLCDSCRNSHFCTQLKDIKAMSNLSPVSDPLPPRTQIKVTQCPVINKHTKLWAEHKLWMHDYDLNQSIIFHNIIIVIVSINRFDIKMQSTVVMCEHTVHVWDLQSQTVYRYNQQNCLYWRRNLSFTLSTSFWM